MMHMQIFCACKLSIKTEPLQNTVLAKFIYSLISVQAFPTIVVHYGVLCLLQCSNPVFFRLFDFCKIYN